MWYNTGINSNYLLRWHGKIPPVYHATGCVYRRVPAEFICAFTWTTLAQLLTVVVVLLFQCGLRRYESGSAVQIQV